MVLVLTVTTTSSNQWITHRPICGMTPPLCLRAFGVQKGRRFAPVSPGQKNCRRVQQPLKGHGDQERTQLLSEKPWLEKNRWKKRHVFLWATLAAIMTTTILDMIELPWEWWWPGDKVYGIGFTTFCMYVCMYVCVCVYVMYVMLCT